MKINPWSWPAAGMLLLASCLAPLQVKQAELSMDRYPPHPDACAVVTERSGSVRLSYFDEPTAPTFEDRSRSSTDAVMNKIKAGSYSPDRPEIGRLTLDISGMNLEVTQRTKVFTAACKGYASVAEAVPEGARLVRLEGVTFLPDGQEVRLDADLARIDSNRLCFEMPAVAPGAVFIYRYSVRAPSLGDLFEWVFQKDLPVARSRFSLRMQAGTPLEFRFLYTQEGQDPAPREDKAGGEGRWRNLTWELIDLPPAHPDRDAASLMITSQQPSWR